MSGDRQDEKSTFSFVCFYERVHVGGLFFSIASLSLTPIGPRFLLFFFFF